MDEFIKLESIVSEKGDMRQMLVIFPIFSPETHNCETEFTFAMI